MIGLTTSEGNSVSVIGSGIGDCEGLSFGLVKRIARHTMDLIRCDKVIVRAIKFPLLGMSCHVLAGSLKIIVCDVETLTAVVGIGEGHTGASTIESSNGTLIVIEQVRNRSVGLGGNRRGARAMTHISAVHIATDAVKKLGVHSSDVVHSDGNDVDS